MLLMRGVNRIQERRCRFPALLDHLRRLLWRDLQGKRVWPHVMLGLPCTWLAEDINCAGATSVCAAASTALSEF